MSSRDAQGWATKCANVALPAAARPSRLSAGFRHAQVMLAAPGIASDDDGHRRPIARAGGVHDAAGIDERDGGSRSGGRYNPLTRMDIYGATCGGVCVRAHGSILSDPRRIAQERWGVKRSRGISFRRAKFGRKSGGQKVAPPKSRANRGDPSHASPDPARWPIPPSGAEGFAQC